MAKNADTKKLNVKQRVTTVLDMGTSSAKAVRMKISKEGAELLDFEIKPSLKDIAMMKDSKSIVVSLSGPAVISRYVYFPRMKADELQNSLRFEAQKHIPFPVADLNLDSFVLRPELPDNKMLVLLVAVKKETVIHRIEAIKQAGYGVSSVDIDAIALVNAFNFNYPPVDQEKPQAAALLNIGASFTNLSILEGDMPRLSRDIHIGGNNVTQKIADMFGIDLAEAEKLKLSPDEDRKSKIVSCFESIATGLAGEIRTSFDFYESQSTTSVAKIFLSGGGGACPEIPGMLKNLLGIDVELWDPLKNIKLSAKIGADKARSAANVLGVAIGLGLRSN